MSELYIADARPPLQMRLVDRSRSEQGKEHCLRSRYLGYHAGPTGYGWARKAQSIPAVTGTRVHEPTGEILLWSKANGGKLPPDQIVYEAIQRARQGYMDSVEARGLVLTAGEDLQFRMNEQLTLLEGLVWAWSRCFLPNFLQEWEIVEVEEEHVVTIGCTCGLGDLVGTAWDHDVRGCGGYGWMTRGDCIARQKAFPHAYAYFERKTTSEANVNWEAQWQYRNQTKAGVLGAEQKYGVQIDQVFIEGLIKGRRQSEWNPEEGKASGPKYQNSPLVYGWFRPANPPLVPESWAASYYYIDEAGKRRKLTGGYKRTGVWELGENYWKVGGTYSPVDYWTRWLGVDKLRESYRVIGPIFRQQWQLDEWRRQTVAEERRVDAGLIAIYQAAEYGGDVQQAIDEHFPMTRGSHCQNHFGDTCPFLSLCNREPGWEDPTLLGFIPRRPHHDPELAQAISRGLLPAQEGLEEEVED